MNALVKQDQAFGVMDFGGIPDFGDDYESSITESLQGVDKRNKISLQSCYFTLNKADGTVIPGGNQFLNVLIIAVNPYQSRSYFTGTFGAPDSKLVCNSTNGIAPNKYITDETLALNNCGPTCATCQYSVKGSHPSGQGKACGESLHIVVLPELDSATPYALNLSVTALIELKNYTNALKQQAKVHNKKAPIEFIRTQLYFEAFDEHGKAYPRPRLKFRALGFIDQAGVNYVKTLLDNPEVLRLAYNDEESIAQQRTAADMMNRAPQQPVFNAPGAYQQQPVAPVQQQPVYHQHPIGKTEPIQQSVYVSTAQQPVVQPQSTPAWGQPAAQPQQSAPSAAAQAVQDAIAKKRAAQQGDNFAG